MFGHVRASTHARRIASWVRSLVASSSYGRGWPRDLLSMRPPKRARPFLEWYLKVLDEPGKLDGREPGRIKESSDIVKHAPPGSQTLEKIYAGRWPQQIIIEEISKNSSEWFSNILVLSGDPSTDHELHKLEISLGPGSPARASNIRTQDFDIHARAPDLRLEIRRCWIARVHVCSGDPILLELNDCWIGELRVKSGSIHSLKVRGGSIFSVKCPPAYEKNPFRGEVTIERCYMPGEAPPLHGSPGHRPSGSGAQDWANCRAHLAAMHNPVAAGLIHGVELRRLGRDQGGLLGFLTWLYDVTSNFGNSVRRPLIGIGAAFAVMFVTTLIANGAHPVPGSDLANWRLALQSRWWSALVLCLQPVLSPLGGLAGSNAVEPANLPIYPAMGCIRSYPSPSYFSCCLPCGGAFACPDAPVDIEQSVRGRVVD